MDPFVEITEKPMGQGVRFRYESEGRTAGSILGERSTAEHRTFPSIKIHCYSGLAVAHVSCVTADRPHRLHPHKLVGTNCEKGVCIVKITGCSDPIPFSNIGVQCCTRKDINKNLEERRNIIADPFPNAASYSTNVDTFDLTTICLCFQVYVNIDGKPRPLKPVVSNPIVDKKVCSELAIHRLSRISGSVRGGDEVFLFCSKIKKEDIKVVFSYEPENGRPWESEGIFSSTDVHKQYAIVFKTPPYCQPDITKPVDVCLHLKRPSDNMVGEAKTFTFYPENPDPYGINVKRRRMTETPSSFSIPSFRDSTQPSRGLADVVAGNQWNFPAQSISARPPVNIPVEPFSIPSSVDNGFRHYTSRSQQNSITAPNAIPRTVPGVGFETRPQSSYALLDDLGPHLSVATQPLCYPTLGISSNSVTPSQVGHAAGNSFSNACQPRVSISVDGHRTGNTTAVATATSNAVAFSVSQHSLAHVAPSLDEIFQILQPEQQSFLHDVDYSDTTGWTDEDLHAFLNTLEADFSSAADLSLS